MTRRAAALGWLVAVALGTMVLASCAAPAEGDEKTIRLWTDDYYIRVTSEPSPPRALEQVQYTVVVQDKKTREPIEIGEGRIFATNEDRKNTHNGFEKGAEPGTYRTTMFFATAGPWAMGVQFRRDSTQKLQQSNDWMQEVLGASEPGMQAPKSGPGQ